MSNPQLPRRNLRREQLALPLTRQEFAIVRNWILRGLPAAILLIIKYPSLFAAAYADYYSDVK